MEMLHSSTNNLQQNCGYKIKISNRSLVQRRVDADCIVMYSNFIQSSANVYKRFLFCLCCYRRTSEWAVKWFTYINYNNAIGLSIHLLFLQESRTPSASAPHDTWHDSLYQCYPNYPQTSVHWGLSFISCRPIFTVNNEMILNNLIPNN